MKVLLVDPQGIPYSTAQAEALGKITELVYITRQNRLDLSKADCRVLYWFKAARKKNRLTQCLKGISYVAAYWRILRLAKREKADVIHIHWFSLPRFDRLFLKAFRRLGIRIVFMAHNVLPHVGGERYFSSYKKLYGLCDRITVFGEAIRKEFCSYYPEDCRKIRVIRHGVYFGLPKKADLATVDGLAQKKLNGAKKVFLFFGNLRLDKGVDLLIREWIGSYADNKDVMLAVVGMKHPSYTELTRLEPQIAACGNIYYKPEILAEEELNYYLEKSDIVLMPYRHASMSGILFKAAEAAKPVLTTDVGAIREYLPGDYPYIAGDTDEFLRMLSDIVLHAAPKILRERGAALKRYYRKEYAWEPIAVDIVSQVYGDA